MVPPPLVGRTRKKCLCFSSSNTTQARPSKACGVACTTRWKTRWKTRCKTRWETRWMTRWKTHQPPRWERCSHDDRPPSEVRAVPTEERTPPTLLPPPTLLTPPTTASTASTAAAALCRRCPRPCQGRRRVELDEERGEELAVGGVVVVVMRGATTTRMCVHPVFFCVSIVLSMLSSYQGQVH